MKIAILTLPLITNYGGILQAYALQAVLKRMGHEVWTEKRKEKPLRLMGRIKMFIKRILGPIRKIYYATGKQDGIIFRYTDSFIYKYIATTEVRDFNIKEVSKKNKFDAYIVGSDQVWRPGYSSYLPNYFLDFVTGEKVKRIAYAASFGTSKWKFSPEQTKQCSMLLKEFDAVSVREDSGVELCNKYLGMRAVHLLDPTMLLKKEDYIRLVELEQTSAFENKLMTYILDQSEEKQQILQRISTALNLNSIVVLPEKNFWQVGTKGIDKCIFPPVTNWLRGFMDANYVVTDSFHGVVFSIIFNKPFIAILNEDRGEARFVSLLKMFDLEERLVYSLNDVTDELINSIIDFGSVNRIWEKEREKAMVFFNTALNEAEYK